MTTIAKSDLEQQIDDLGQWAAMLELSAHDATMPYWMRQKDAEHAKAIRDEQMRLLERAAAQAKPLPKCAVENCKNIAIGSPYCARCEEEITGTPYPFAAIIIGETIYERVKRFLREVFCEQ